MVTLKMQAETDGKIRPKLAHKIGPMMVMFGLSGKLDNNSNLNGIRKILLSSCQSERFDLLMHLGKSLAAQKNPMGEKLLDSFEHSARCLLNIIQPNYARRVALASQWRWIRVKSALYVRAAALRCLRFENFALHMLSVIESNLRVPLGYEPRNLLPPSNLFDLAIGIRRVGAVLADENQNAFQT